MHIFNILHFFKVEHWELFVRIMEPWKVLHNSGMPLLRLSFFRLVVPSSMIAGLLPFCLARQEFWLFKQCFVVVMTVTERLPYTRPKDFPTKDVSHLIN